MAADTSLRVGADLGEGWRRHARPEWLAAWTPRAFDLGDGVTEVVTIGEGPPLLLLPPLPGWKEAWLAVAGPLARRHRVVTFDLRVRHAGVPSWASLVADLERLTDALAPGPAIVVGHSLGGALAQHWALHRPDRVRGLVLSSSFARVRHAPGHLWKRFVEQPLVLASQRLLPDPRAQSLAAACAHHGAWVYDPECDARVLGFVRHAIRRTRFADARAGVRLAFAHDTLAALGGITAPTLVLVGERESGWARGASAELARAIPHAEQRALAGVSHLHPLSAPERFVAEVEAWIARAVAPVRTSLGPAPHAC